jgi:hypothetical protein
MKYFMALLAISILYFMTLGRVEAQVDPGNDPVMWNYVDPTQFWIILVVLIIVGGGFTVYFRRKPATKDGN